MIFSKNSSNDFVPFFVSNVCFDRYLSNAIAAINWKTPGTKIQNKALSDQRNYRYIFRYFEKKCRKQYEWWKEWKIGKVIAPIQ